MSGSVTPWTDMEALCEAIRKTGSRAEAAALVATWRSPRRAKQLRLPVVGEPPPVANDTLSREEQVEAARGVVRAIVAASDKAGAA